MTAEPSDTPNGGRGSAARLGLWFVAGFIAVLIFHQGMLGILHGLGASPRGPYPMASTWPFGVPQVFSLAFWGGVWGIVLGLIEPRLPKGWLYWLCVILFGAILPTAVAVLVVLPLKGIQIPPGAMFAGLMVGLAINAAWGIGTALFYRLGDRLVGRGA